MTATPEQLASVAEPSTTAQTLADLAYAEPDLWPAIAAHPNVYPDLLDWMHANESVLATPTTDSPSAAELEPVANANEPDLSSTDASSPEPEPKQAPGPEQAEEVEPPAVKPAVVKPAELKPAVAPTPIWRRISPRTRKRIIISASAVVAAATAASLVVSLVVVPQQQAAAAAEQAHKIAVTNFDAATSDCASANGDLEGGIKRAELNVGTDTSTMDDPSLIDQLKSALATARTAPHCSAPTRATGTQAIRKQTDSLIGATTSVHQAASAISDASGLVDATVAKKTQAAAAAAAAVQAAAAAAEAAKRTWHLASADGYNFDMSILVGATTTSGTLGQYSTPSGCTSLTQAGCTTKTVAVGEGCSNFDTKTMIAVPVTVTFTARTQNFDTFVGASLRVGTSGSYQGPNQVGYDFLGSYVEEEAVYSSGPTCATGSGYGGGPSFGVSFPDVLKVGQSDSYKFDIIIEKWTSPNAPSGDRALLDWITIQPGVTTPQDGTISYTPNSSKSISLNGNVIGG
jgi:hypothetical protein